MIILKIGAKIVILSVFNTILLPMKNLFLFVFTLIYLISCDLSKRIDTSQAVKEMELRKVKRILPKEIAAEATRYGQDIEALLSKNISEDSIKKKYGVQLIVGKASDLKKMALDKKLLEVLDAVEYAQENQQSIPATIQKNSLDDSLFYIFSKEKSTYLVGFSKKNIILNFQTKK